MADSVEEDDGEQSRRDAPQKPYRLSPEQDLESHGSGGLLSRTAVHAVAGMGWPEGGAAHRNVEVEIRARLVLCCICR